MDFLLTIQTLIWLFPIMFIIHDFEEIIMVEKWLHNNQTNLYKRLPTKIADRIVKQFSMTTAQFAVAVLLIFLLISAATISANIYFYNGIATNLYFFIIITSIFFIHAFTHIGQTILFRSLTPGTVTSLIIIIPYSILLYRSLFMAEIVTWKMIIICLPFGLLFFPIVLIAHWLGRKFIE